MGNMIGSGVFLLPASLAAYGGLSLVGWVVSAAGAVCWPWCLLGSRGSGRSAGDRTPTRVKRMVTWRVPRRLGLLISTWSTNAALAVAFVGYLDPFIPSVVRTPVAAASLAVGMVWLLTAVNCAGIRSRRAFSSSRRSSKSCRSARSSASPARLLRPLAFLDPGGARMAASASGLMATVTLTLWAFVGLECATIPAGSTANANSTIPRATIIGTLLTAVVYLSARSA